MNSSLAAGAYAVIACVMGHRVLAALTTTVASDPGDPLLNAAILAWNATHVPWTDEWFQFPIFHPTRDALTLSEHLLGLSLIATPLYWTTGNPVAAYNLTLLLTYPLSGMAMYALVWRITRSSTAAFIAGLAFAFAPYRAAQLPHIQMLAMFWAPLALLGLHRFVEPVQRTAGPHLSAGPPSAAPAPHRQQQMAGPAPDRQPETARPAPQRQPERAGPPAQVQMDQGPDSAAAIGSGGPGERWPWLALFAVCWALQGAANGYMLVYFSLLVGAWVLWFLAARRRWQETAWVVCAAVAASIPLLPILYRYLTAQRALGLSRNLGEISSYSADLAALACAPSTLTFWGWLRVACAPEGELFPGLAVVVVCLVGVGLARRSGFVRAGLKPRRCEDAALTPRVGHARSEAPAASDPERSSGLSAPPSPATSHDARGTIRRSARLVAVALAVLFLGIAVSTWLAGPWRIDLGPIRASASSADKPLSTALALLLIAFLLSDRWRGAIARGSTATFYGGAAGVCWMLSWGPFPRLFDAPILYQAPYAWLLQLPGLDALRAPARFWMLTVLCLSVLAGMAIARLLRDSTARARGILTAVAAGAFLLDGWIVIPIAAVPPPPADASSLRGAPVLVSPVGDLDRDAAVVYHAVTGGWTSVNGYSGYEPGYYDALRTLSQAGDDRQYDAFLRRDDLLVVDDGVVRRLSRRRAAETTAPPGGRPLAVLVRDTSCSAHESAAAVDGNPDTRWTCGAGTADHQITVDAGAVQGVGAIVLELGTAGAAFPRSLIAETSIDGAVWQTAWEGNLAAAVLEAALDRPRETRLVIPFSPRTARYVRLRRTGGNVDTFWSIAELEVWSGN